MRTRFFREMSAIKSLRSKCKTLVENVMMRQRMLPVHVVVAFLKRNDCHNLSTFMRWYFRLYRHREIRDEHGDSLTSVVLKSPDYDDAVHERFLKIILMSDNGGCGPLHRNFDGTLALHTAIRLNLKQATVTLLEHVAVFGTGAVEIDFYGNLLRYAVRYVRLEIVKLLLATTECLRELDSCDETGRTALIISAGRQCRRHCGIDAVSDDYGSDMKDLDSSDSKCCLCTNDICDANCLANLKIASALLEAGANAHVENSYGHTATHECLRNEQMTDLFLNFNVRFNVATNPRTAIVTPLGYAVGLGNVSVVRALVERGQCSVNDCTIFRSSAAHLAAPNAFSDSKVFRYVVARGARVSHSLANLDAMLIVFRNGLQQLMFLHNDIGTWDEDEHEEEEEEAYGADIVDAALAEATPRTRPVYMDAVNEYRRRRVVRMHVIVFNMFQCLTTAMAYGYKPTEKLLELLFRYPTLSEHTICLTQTLLETSYPTISTTHRKPYGNTSTVSAFVDGRNETFASAMYSQNSSISTCALLVYVAIHVSVSDTTAPHGSDSSRIRRSSAGCTSGYPYDDNRQLLRRQIGLASWKNCKYMELSSLSPLHSDRKNNIFAGMPTKLFDAQTTILFDACNLHSINLTIYTQCIDELNAMKKSVLVMVPGYAPLTVYQFLVRKTIAPQCLLQSVVAEKLNSPNFLRQFKFYGQYATERYSKMIHIVEIRAAARRALSIASCVDFECKHYDICEHFFDKYLSEMDVYMLSRLV